MLLRIVSLLMSICLLSSFKYSLAGGVDFAFTRRKRLSYRLESLGAANQPERVGGKHPCVLVCLLAEPDLLEEYLGKVRHGPRISDKAERLYRPFLRLHQVGDCLSLSGYGA